MSVEAVAAALEHSEAKPTDRFVLVVLSEAANREQGHEAWLAVDTLRARTGLSERAVQRALTALVAAGEIELVGERRGGRGRSTRYRMALVEKGGSVPPFDQGETPAGSTERAAGSTVNPGSLAPDPLGTERNRRARARGADRAAPRGQQNGSGESRIPGVPVERPCHDCRQVTTLHQGRCDPCYERWAEAVLEEHEAVEASEGTT